MKFIIPSLMAASLVVLILVSERSMYQDRGSEPAPTPEKTIVAVGEKGLLHSADHRNYVMVFSSPLVLAAYARAGGIGDTYGQSRLIDGEHVFDTPEGTRVLVINQVLERGIGLDEVRLLDGPHTGEAVWVGVLLVEGI